MEKILITGAAGFIGSQLAYRLWQDGCQLVLIDNFSYGSEDNLIFEKHDFRDEVLKIDIRDREAIYHLFETEKFSYVYHIAAITPLPDCQTEPVEAIEVNVAGTVNILEAVRKYGAKKVIFASTSAVYENTEKFPSVEDEVVPPSLIYPNTKYTAECYCRSYSAVYGMDIVCLRFANVYGPHLDCLRKQPPVVGYLIREFYNDRSPVLHFTGEQKRDFVYVEDLVDLCVCVQQETGFDIVNVSTNSVLSINDLTRAVAKLMGKEDMKPVYVASENYWKHYPYLYEGAYRISEKALEHEVTKFTRLSNQHALEKYGWSPKVDLETGLRNTIDFSVNILAKAENE